LRQTFRMDGSWIAAWEFRKLLTGNIGEAQK
jgi:hypothetical protein